MHRKVGGKRRESSTREREKPWDNINYLHNAIHVHPFIVYKKIFDRKKTRSRHRLIQYTTNPRYPALLLLFFTGEGTVLWVDKTNLGQLHVTPTVFKHLGIVRPTTNTLYPLFISPRLIHGNSDRKTYSTFFYFNKQELEEAPKEPVIGSDKEMAIR